jgi:RimJ/RimL family protein N-acetyltransferase
MITIVTAQDRRLLEWAMDKLGIEFAPSDCRWLAGIEGAEIRFVLVYHNFTERDCQLTIATDGSRRWATRRTLHAIFATPFDIWKLARLTFLCDQRNLGAIDLVQRLGASQEGTLRRYFADDADGYLFGMQRANCRWISR